MSKLLKLIVPLLLLFGIGATFLREVLVAYYYGSSRDVESFRIAFAVPYALFQSLGAVLIGGLLPLCINGKDCRIKKIAKQVHVFFGLIFVLAWITVPWQVKILAPGFSVEELTVLQRDMYWCWGILLLSALIFPHRLLLQASDRVFLVSSTSMVFSICFMIFLIAQVYSPFSYGSELSIASVLSMLVIYFLFVYVGKYQIRPANETTDGNINVRQVYRVLVGALAYVILLATPRLVDRAVASSYNEGVIANIDYAMNFYVAFGVLLGTSYITLMARKIASSHVEGIDLGWYVRVLLAPFLLSIFVAVVVVFNAEALVAIAYGRGAFTEEAVVQTAEILYWFMFSLPVMVMGMVAAQLLMAGNVVALVVIAILKVCIKGLVIVWVGAGGMEVFGLSTLLMEMAGVIMMVVYFFWRQGFWRHLFSKN